MPTEFLLSKRIALVRIRNFSYNGITVRLESGDVLLTDATNYQWAYTPVT